jgi:hypothetical protein
MCQNTCLGDLINWNRFKTRVLAITQMHHRFYVNCHVLDNRHAHMQSDAVCTRRCLLCGTDGHGVSFRTRSTAYVYYVLTTYIQETPFVWSHIIARLQSSSKDTNVEICAPCMQWMLRACKYASQKTSRYMLLVDQLFMCVMHPGRAPGKTACIQARVYSRIIRTLRQKGNTLMMLCPLVARDIVANKLQCDHKKPLMHIMQLYWENSGSPEILPSAEVARAVRFYV